MTRRIRLSTDEDDPGYWPGAGTPEANGINVLLDGKEVSAKTADEAAGEVVVLAEDANGELLHDSEGMPYYVTLFGRVEILLPARLEYLRERQ